MCKKTLTLDEALLELDHIEELHKDRSPLASYFEMGWSLEQIALIEADSEVGNLAEDALEQEQAEAEWQAKWAKSAWNKH